eukprot:Selendium_serpulae@DN6888_c0_g1_i2.p1
MTSPHFIYTIEYIVFNSFTCFVGRHLSPTGTSCQEIQSVKLTNHQTFDRRIVGSSARVRGGVMRVRGGVMRKRGGVMRVRGGVMRVRGGLMKIPRSLPH